MSRSRTSSRPRKSRKGRPLVATFIACALALPFVMTSGVARADDTKDCAPGSWFCGDTTPPPAGGNSNLQPLPAETKPASPPPPVVIYQPPPTVVVAPREAPPAYYYVPRKAPERRKEWGVNLHAGGLILGSGRNNDAGMGLVGLGMRFRPVPHFALEADLDFASGRDYNGFRRNETSLAFNGLIFLNPRNKTQVYFLGGFGWQDATAVDDYNGYDGNRYKYGYFGGQAGIGLEFRLSRVVALNFDFRGFVRGRIDNARHDRPEFVDSNGRTTNTSGGALLQGGLTFYW